MYAGYGDLRLFDPDTEKLASRNQQVFLKVSYAWQR